MEHIQCKNKKKHETDHLDFLAGLFHLYESSIQPNDFNIFDNNKTQKYKCNDFIHVFKANRYSCQIWYKKGHKITSKKICLAKNHPFLGKMPTFSVTASICLSTCQIVKKDPRDAGAPKCDWLHPGLFPTLFTNSITFLLAHCSVLMVNMQIPQY